MKKTKHAEIIKLTPEFECKHTQFIKIGEETKKEGEMVPTPVRWGIRIMCCFCGERRILWTDGEVEIV